MTHSFQGAKLNKQNHNDFKLTLYCQYWGLTPLKDTFYYRLHWSTYFGHKIIKIIQLQRKVVQAVRHP